MVIANRIPIEWVIEYYKEQKNLSKGSKKPYENSSDKYFVINLIGKLVTLSLEANAIFEKINEFNF